MTKPKSRAYVKMIVWNTPELHDFKATDVVEMDGTGAESFYSQMFEFIKKKLNSGVFECILAVDITYSKHPDLPEHMWASEATFELLDYVERDTDYHSSSIFSSI